MDIRVIPQSVKLCAETFWCNLISGDSVRRCAFSASSETDFVLFHCDMLIPPPHTPPSTPHSVCLSFLVVHQGAAVNQKAAQSLTPTSLRAAPVTASIIRPPAQTLQR